MNLLILNTWCKCSNISVCMLWHSVELDSLRHYGPWDSSSKNTGVDCHFLLQGIFPTQGSKQTIFVGKFFDCDCWHFWVACFSTCGECYCLVVIKASPPFLLCHDPSRGLVCCCGPCCFPVAGSLCSKYWMNERKENLNSPSHHSLDSRFPCRPSSSLPSFCLFCLFHR